MANYSITVINNYPSLRATEVARDAEIEIILNRDLKVETLDGNLKVEKVVSGVATLISGTISYESRSIKFRPNDQLDALTEYKVTLVGDSVDNVANDGIKDVFENMMLGDFVFTFTTKDGAVLNPPLITAPIESTSFTEVPLISWQEVVGAVSYDVYLSTVSDFSSDLWHTTTMGGTTSVTPTALIDGPYFCRVRYSKDNEYSPWSETIRFYIEGANDIVDEYGSYFEVTRTNPENDSANMDINTQLTFNFNNNVDESTVEISVIELPNTIITSSFTVNTTLVTIAAILQGNKSYKIIAKGSTASTDGDELGEDYTLSFTTTYSPIYCDYSNVYDDLTDLLPGIKPHYIYQAIRDASEYANGLVTTVEDLKGTLGKTDWTNVPFHIKQFVRFQAEYTLYQRFEMQKATGSGMFTQLGDFIVQDTGNRSLTSMRSIMKGRIKPWLDMIMGIGVTRGFATAKSVVKGENTDYPTYYDRTITSSSTTTSSS